MIQRKNNYIYVKDVIAPKDLIISLTGGINICGNNYSNGKKVTVNISPAQYLHKSDIFTDLISYITAIFSNVFDHAFIDGRTVKEFMEIFKNNNVSLNMLQKMILDMDSTLYDMEFFQKVSFNDEVFNCLSFVIDGVNDFNSDLTKFFTTPLDCFKAIFTDMDVTINSVRRNGAGHCFKGSSHLMFTKDFLNMLCKVFFFYLSQDYRNESTCYVLMALSIIDSNNIEERSEVLQWNADLEKYMYYYTKKENTFKVSDLATDINVPHNMSEKYSCLRPSLKSSGGEKCNPFEKMKLELQKAVSNEVFVTEINRSGYEAKDYNGLGMINTYNAYMAYSNNQVGRDAAVSINLYTAHNNDIYNSIYNNIIYTSNLFWNIYSNGYLNEICDYSLFDNNSFKARLADPNYKIMCDVCYFTKGGGVTFKSAASLETAKIPKEKRDCIFEALCVLCEELDVNIKDITDNLKVDFTRLYKKVIDSMA